MVRKRKDRNSQKIEKISEDIKNNVSNGGKIWEKNKKRHQKK